MPGITNWQSPNWFGYFPANISYPGILGDLLSSGLGVQGMSWATAPACTEVEVLMLDWMQELLDLPARFRSTSETGGGVIQGSASEATLVALLSARWRAQHRHRRERRHGQLVARHHRRSTRLTPADPG